MQIVPFDVCGKHIMLSFAQQRNKLFFFNNFKKFISFFQSANNQLFTTNGDK